MKHARYLMMLPVAAFLVACGEEPGPVERTVGLSPELPEPKRGILPNMTISKPMEWGDDLPTVPEGYTVSAIATDLNIPRQTLVLPNGDILVAEGRGGYAPKLKPKDIIAGVIKGMGTTSVPSGNRLTLLRDEDDDGVFELKTAFAEDLNAPYGLALVNGRIYVANQDEVVWFEYEDGQTKANGPPESLTELPKELNHHWTKAMTASADGRYLYVGIGSNSNITERGMTAEADRAVIWEIDIETGARRTYASGVRNPTALTIQPGTGQLWAVVNERDEIGPDLVPDYLTAIQEGGFYGWPYSYWGSNVDDRVRPQDPDKVASTITPDYALGSHVASLGVDFSNEAVGGDFTDGVFVGMHGSWNRAEPVGYKVVFVPFTDGRPSGQPVDFLAGFLNAEEKRTRGRPVGVTVDPRGAVIVADDLSNTVWRVTPPGGLRPREEVAAEAANPAAADAPATPRSGTPETQAPDSAASGAIGKSESPDGPVEQPDPEAEGEPRPGPAQEPSPAPGGATGGQAAPDAGQPPTEGTGGQPPAGADGGQPAADAPEAPDEPAATGN